MPENKEDLKRRLKDVDNFLELGLEEVSNGRIPKSVSRLHSAIEALKLTVAELVEKVED